MKKIVMSICLSAFLILDSGFVYADDDAEARCTEKKGIFTSKGEGHPAYCRSPRVMNWWSAHAWFQTIGGELVDMVAECGEELQSTWWCSNLKFDVSGYSWTRNVSDKSHAYIIFLSSGQFGDYSLGNPYFALCKNF